MKRFKKITNCRICNSKKLKKYLDLGSQPLANSFLKKKDFKLEKRYPLELLFCKKCSLSQLSVVVDPKLIFNKYDYLSSSSKALSNHYNILVNGLEKKYNLKNNSTVVDIGCNDGVLLCNYSKKINNFSIPGNSTLKKLLCKTVEMKLLTSKILKSKTTLFQLALDHSQTYHSINICQMLFFYTLRPVWSN